MPEVQPPLFVDLDLQYAARHLGLPFRDLISEGVLGAEDFAVTERASGANLSVDVAAGAAYILGDDQPSAQPNYRVRSDSVVNLVAPAADASNPRVDLVVAEVLDSFFSGAQRLWRLRYVTGTPAASPSAPAIPANALVLAEVSVPATDTTITDAQITDLRPAAIAAGGAGLSAGPAYHDHIMTNQNVPGLGFTNAATDGPLVVVPHRGDYFALGKCTFRNVDAGAFYTPRLGVGVGDFAVPVDESLTTPPQAGNAAGSCMVMVMIPDVPAGATIKLRYANSSSGKANVEHRSLAVWPL